MSTFADEISRDCGRSRGERSSCSGTRSPTNRELTRTAPELSTILADRGAQTITQRITVDGIITTAIAIVFHACQLQTLDAGDFDAKQFPGFLATQAWLE